MRAILWCSTHLQPEPERSLSGLEPGQRGSVVFPETTTELRIVRIVRSARRPQPQVDPGGLLPEKRVLGPCFPTCTHRYAANRAPTVTPTAKGNACACWRTTHAIATVDRHENSTTLPAFQIKSFSPYK
jgi:hypothetical protein